MKLLKLLRLLKLKALLGSHAKKVAMPPMVADFFKNLFVLVFFAHIMSCVWYGGGLNRYNNTTRAGVTFSKLEDDGNVTTYRFHACIPIPDDEGVMPAADASVYFATCSPLIQDNYPNKGVGIPTDNAECRTYDESDCAAAGGACIWDAGSCRKFDTPEDLFSPLEAALHFLDVDDGSGSFSTIIPEKHSSNFVNSTVLGVYEAEMLAIMQGGDNFTNASWFTSEGDSWLVWTGTADLEKGSDRYWASVYWCFATFLAVGYGDIYATSTNNLEIFIAVLAMSFGTIAFAMFISAVVNLVDDTLEQNGASRRSASSALH